jgi:hypothetical protein
MKHNYKQAIHNALLYNYNDFISSEQRILLIKYKQQKQIVVTGGKSS